MSKIIVAGAGHGGVVTAIKLAKAGHEVIIFEKNQQEYYDAIAKAHVDGESTVFVEFMLDMINKALDELDMVANMIKTEASVNVKRLLENMEEEPMTANEIMFKLT